MAKPHPPEGFPAGIVEGSFGPHLLPLFRSIKNYVPADYREQWRQETCLFEGPGGKLNFQMNGHPPTWGPAVTKSVEYFQRELGRKRTGYIDMSLIVELGRRRHVRLVDEMRSFDTPQQTLLRAPTGVWYILKTARPN